MNKIELEKKKNVSITSCAITNTNRYDLLDIHPWILMLNAKVYDGNILLSIKDGDYDIILIDINKNDIHLIDELRNKLGQSKKVFTKIIVYFNSSRVVLRKMADSIPRFGDTVRKADFIFCNDDDIASVLSEIVLKRVFTIFFPTDFYDRDLKNDNWIKVSKEHLLSQLFWELADEKFQIDSLWKRLDLLFPPDRSNTIPFLYKNEINNILGCNTYHDGGTAYLSNGKLLYSIEEEKDSNFRHSSFSDLESQLIKLDSKNLLPDIISLIGYYKQFNYWGVGENENKIYTREILGKKFDIFITSHERAHILCAYGMSHFEQWQPCYALTWEAGIGTFYKIDKNLKITNLGLILRSPGFRYIIPFSVANKKYAFYNRQFTDPAHAGKTMALAGFSSREVKKNINLWRDIIDDLLDFKLSLIKYNEYDKEFFELLKKLPIYNKGVTSQIFKDFAWKLQTTIFDRFYNFARNNLKEGLPLLISGGCGLNCEWNTMWRNSGLFSDVFVPPCPNDSGIAIGAAIDVQFHFTRNAKIDWDVYAGEEFIIDKSDFYDFDVFDLDYNHIADFLLKGNNVIAWVQGKYEIGPRALCHRSLIAAPFKTKTLLKLNRIKMRENYRPIAPVCLEEDVNTYFDWEGPSPYMLYFQKVIVPELKAVTHVDGTARLQTITLYKNERMYNLLIAFKAKTGFSVLCNTSLNFKCKGFINKMSDLVKYVSEREVDGMVVGNKFYIKKIRNTMDKIFHNFKSIHK